jgi:bifunctional non-homologous end joining protein LigD
MEDKAVSSSLHKRPYAMKKHRATRLHYDLRLEWNEVLLSWALPDGPSCHTGVIREAIEMKDHNPENILFEGLYEAKPIMLWDKGAWEPHPKHRDVHSSLEEGMLKFTLHGERLKGEWQLTRVGNTGNAKHPIWTLCKQEDLFARSSTDKCILKELPNSLGGLTMEEIVHRWENPKDRHEKQQGLFD